MKTVITKTFFGALAVLSLNIKASTSPDINSQKEFIQHSVKFPESCDAKNQKVEVLFTTNETGKVNFVLAKTDDKNLKQNLEKQFYNMRFTGMKQNVVNSVVLSFKII